MRGLVALRDIQPNQLLLSVPFQKIYMSAPEHELELHWAAEMAARLLGHMAECKQANKQGSSSPARVLPWQLSDT
jgi:hypothetical protein